ncbi:MAG: peptidylprolyl isomerase [Clostridia bacterium]|nr:peptidylprolyl isomerase [Clostridia bacterium]
MKKMTAVFLLLSVLFLSCACTVTSGAYASYGKYTVTEAMYEYWVGYYKARFYATFADYGLADGENYDESVWDEKQDGGKSLSEQVTEHVQEQIKEMLVCSVLYDELGLSSDKEKNELLKNTVDELINADITAVGSRQNLNRILGGYNMNIDSLRRAFEFEARAVIVAETLFGEGGEHAVTDAEREEYYQNNYIRVKHILIENRFKYVQNDNGEPQMDIYTGKYKTEALTDEEKAGKLELAKTALRRAQNGEDFEALIDEYNTDTGMGAYTDGYFFSADSVMDENYLKASLEAKVGDTVLAETSYGLAVIKKYPLEAGMWGSETNSVFFSDMDDNIILEKKPAVYGERYKDITYGSGAAPFSDIAMLDGRLISDAG